MRNVLQSRVTGKGPWGKGKNRENMAGTDGSRMNLALALWPMAMYGKPCRKGGKTNIGDATWLPP